MNAQSTQPTVKFSVGKTYECRSVCDYDTVWRYEVTRRTAKSIWIKQGNKEPLRKLISVYRGVERVSPTGSYSMAPILTAERLVATDEPKIELTQPDNLLTFPAIKSEPAAAKPSQPSENETTAALEALIEKVRKEAFAAGYQQGVTDGKTEAKQQMLKALT